jgi:AcrR family transcriptional regulator
MNLSETAPAAPATRIHLLDAAERLFAANGAHRTSVRAITRAAGANIAAVNYHFGSKEALVKEVLRRRLAPLNRQRLAVLHSASSLPGDSPSLAAILEAFVAPAVEMVRLQPGGREFARFLARSLSEPDKSIRSMILAEFAGVIEAFTAALRAALPALTAHDVHWRFHFMVGALIHALGFGSLAEQTSGGLCAADDLDSLTHELTTFLEGGFAAPGRRERAS